MFLAGTIIGILIGLMFVRLGMLKKEMSMEAKQFVSDTKDAYHYWKEKRKESNNIVDE